MRVGVRPTVVGAMLNMATAHGAPRRVGRKEELPDRQQADAANAALPITLLLSGTAASAQIISWNH